MQQKGLGHRFLDMIFWLVGVGSLVGALYVYRISQWPKQKKAAQGGGFRFNVKTVAVRRGTIAESIRLVGDIVPLRQVTLHSEVEGTVVKVGAREGQLLKTGGGLVFLQRTDLLLLVKKQEALLQQAKASVQRMKATYQRDKDLWERANRLFKTRHLSEREWIEARYQKEASLAAANENVAQVALREAELNMAQRDLARSMVRVPFSSRVKRLFVEQGRLLRKGDPIAELVADRGIEVRLLIPPAALSRVREGMEVWLQAEQGPGGHLAGSPSSTLGGAIPPATGRSDQVGGWLRATITHLSPVTDTVSRNRQAIIRLDQAPTSFVPGLSVVGRVVIQQRTQALIVPKDALIRSGMDWSVFRVRESKAERVPVQVVVEDAAQVEVQGNLAAGDPVVNVGNEALFPSAPVQVVQGPGAPVVPPSIK